MGQRKHIKGKFIEQLLQDGEIVKDEYIVRKLINFGGSSQIYSADKDGLYLILKVLASPQDMDSSAAQRASEKVSPKELRNLEIKARTDLRTVGNLIPFWESIEHKGLHIIAMQYVHGQDLEERIFDLRFRQSLEFSKEISRIVNNVHEKDYVLGDLNPNNVRILQSRENFVDIGVRLQDYAHARHINAKPEHILTGSRLYHAPERSFGRQYFSSDVFSMGILFFDMFSKGHKHLIKEIIKRFYPNCSEDKFNNRNFVETFLRDLYKFNDKKLLKKYSKIKKKIIREFIPDKYFFLENILIRHVIDKSTNIKPEDRYQNAGEVYGALSNYGTLPYRIISGVAKPPLWLIKKTRPEQVFRFLGYLALFMSVVGTGAFAGLTISAGQYCKSKTNYMAEQIFKHYSLDNLESFLELDTNKDYPEPNIDYSDKTFLQDNEVKNSDSDEIHAREFMGGAYINIIEFLWEKGFFSFENRIAAWRAATRIKETTPEILEDLLKSRMINEDGYQNVGLIYFIKDLIEPDKGHTQKAKDAWERAKENNKANAASYFCLSAVYLSEGNIEDAKSILEEAVNRGKVNSAILCNLGLICEDESDDDQAFKFFNQAYNANSGSSSRNKNKFASFLMNKMKHISSKPKEKSAYEQAHKFQLEKKYDKAIAVLKRAVLLDFSSTRINEKLAYLYAVHRINDVSSTVLEEMVDSGELNASAYHNLGLIYLKKGERDKVKELWEQARQKGEIDAYTYFNLGIQYRKDGDLQKADQVWREAIENNKVNPHLYYHLGLISEKMGSIYQAAAFWRRSKELNKNNKGKDAAEIDKLLDKALMRFRQVELQDEKDGKIHSLFLDDDVEEEKTIQRLIPGAYPDEYRK